jgi:uncharacterized membrane protein SpoIIM required for sporulation
VEQKITTAMKMAIVIVTMMVILYNGCGVRVTVTSMLTTGGTVKIQHLILCYGTIPCSCSIMATCHSGVTVVPQWCYSGVTVLLQ